MNSYGFKILYDSNDYYLCLLKIPKESRIIANDYKYRTDRAYVCDIRRIISYKSKCKVVHYCFYNNILINYQIDTYIEAELDISKEICASGIHYFPFTTSIDCVSNYFKNLDIDWEKVLRILILWNIKIIYQKIPIINSDKYIPLLIQKEYNIIYDFIKKDL
jgi:hypothetical protein